MSNMIRTVMIEQKMIYEERIAALIKERDEARQEICESHCDNLGVVLGSHITPQDYAQRRGWDCYIKRSDSHV